MAGISIGGVQFREMGIPERAVAAGTHMLAVHRLLGGGRVIDAMGDDPRPITWSGIFLGRDAASRARALESMRAAGRRVTVAFGSFSYQGVVKEFAFDYEREYQVRYSIAVEVLSKGGGGAVATLGDLVSADFTTLTTTYAVPTLSDSVAGEIASAQTAVDAVAATTATGQLQDASLAAMQSAIGAASTAYTAVDGAFQAADGSIGEIDLDAASGPSTPDGVASFNAEAAAATALADLAGARGYAGRLVSNLELFPG